MFIIVDRTVTAPGGVPARGRRERFSRGRPAGGRAGARVTRDLADDRAVLPARGPLDALDDTDVDGDGTEPFDEAADDRGARGFAEAPGGGRADDEVVRRLLDDLPLADPFEAHENPVEPHGLAAVRPDHRVLEPSHEFGEH